MNYLNISLDLIDTSDVTYFVPPVQKSRFCFSDETSLYNPIWLQSLATGTYRIVDGFQVVTHLLQSTPDASLLARVFPEDSNLLDLWKLRIQKRQHECNLSVFGFLEGLSKLLTTLNLNELPIEAVDICRQMGLPEKEISLAFLSDLNAKAVVFSQFVELHQVGFKELTALSKMDIPTLNQLSVLFAEQQLKGNKLMSMFQLIDELDRGYQTNLPTILQDEVITDILAHTPANHRYKKIKSRLITLRWPELSKLQNDWDATISRLALPGQIQVAIDPWFEDDAIQFILTAASTTELHQQLEELLQRCPSPALHHLFDFL